MGRRIFASLTVEELLTMASRRHSPLDVKQTLQHSRVYTEHRLMAKLKKLLFIDANISLDFYRGRNETALALIKHAEAVADRVIVTTNSNKSSKRCGTCPRRV